MSDFEIYIDDARYKVPTLHLITNETEARARQIADRLWQESHHHSGVELRHEGELLYAAGSCSELFVPNTESDERTCL
jgi:hypothetical protein